MSKTVIHRAGTHGVSSNGRVYTEHVFSFADYFDVERINFGMLRAANDMSIAPGEGLENHPHSDMEIIMVIMKGDLLHTDSLGNKVEVHRGYVQTITSGTGYSHEEINLNKNESIRFFHFWVFPYKKGLKPNYSYKQFDTAKEKNELLLLVSPNKDDDVTLIQQNAWTYISKLDTGKSLDYELKSKENGVYIIIVSGNIEIEKQSLKSDDGIGIWETDKIEMKAIDETQIIMIEVPMNAYKD